jgi:hypothetical protein
MMSGCFSAYLEEVANHLPAPAKRLLLGNSTRTASRRRRRPNDSSELCSWQANAGDALDATGPRANTDRAPFIQLLLWLSRYSTTPANQIRRGHVLSALGEPGAAFLPLGTDERPGSSPGRFSRSSVRDQVLSTTEARHDR